MPGYLISPLMGWPINFVLIFFYDFVFCVQNYAISNATNLQRWSRGFILRKNFRKYLDNTPCRLFWTFRANSLCAIIGDKPHFILTTNGDTHLELSGFDPACVWEIEGTFTHLLQGKQPDNKQDVVNSFLSQYTGKRLVVLELGIGSRNRIIKQPLMQLVEHEPNATYITLNLPHELYIPEEIADKSIALPGDIAITLMEMNICMEGMRPHTETASTGKRWKKGMQESWKST